MSSLSSRYQELQVVFLSIYRLLLAEQDLTTLMQGVCDRLVNGKLHCSAWLVLYDSESDSVVTVESGLGERFHSFVRQLRNSHLHDCVRKSFENEGCTPVLCHDCSCGLCRNDENSRTSAVASAFHCRAGLVGFLVVELFSSSEKPDSAEMVLYRELAESIGIALRRMFFAEESRSRQVELKCVEERFKLALSASKSGLWDWNIKSGEIYTSPDRSRRLDYRQGDGGSGAGVFWEAVHSDDKDRVLISLHDHLAGKTDEYRIEYRIRGRDGEWKWFFDRGRVVERDEKHMPVRMTGTHQDITFQKKQSQALAAIQLQLHETVDSQKNFLQTVINSAVDPVMAIDLDYNVLLMNRAASLVLGVKEDITHQGRQKCFALFCGADTPCEDPDFPCPVQATQRTGEPVTLVHNSYHGNGVNNTFEIEVSPLRDRDGIIYGSIEVARDITDRLRIEKDLRESRSRLYRLAHHDSLTGMPNRLLFKDRLEQAMLKARRTEGKVVVLFLDLDKFKEVNDTLGHDVGDELLVEVARRLQALCRQSDTVARLGGDEFVFLLDNVKKRSGAETVAQKISVAMAKPVLINGHELLISASIGIAVFPDDGGDIEEVIRKADTALYQAKKGGRNRFVFYRPGMTMG
jgi:diguanylate cyclase (GGDEF)-like protein